MLGFNGGLIGKDRTSSLSGAVGVWTLSEQVKAKRNNLWTNAFDPDAFAYITAVEVNDGNQTLEDGVRTAINTFVVGCKSDGIWSAIKASCILAGARTLAGALTPLVGTAPTNVSGNLTSGDYNRKTGVNGGSGKSIRTNRNNNADPQNSNHNAIYATTEVVVDGAWLGVVANFGATGTNNMGDYNRLFQDSPYFRNRNSSGSVRPGNEVTATGLIAMERREASSFTTRLVGLNNSHDKTSQTPHNGIIDILLGSRTAFYSIGESLDLALLDTRVTTLINAIAEAIP